MNDRGECPHSSHFHAHRNERVPVYLSSTTSVGLHNSSVSCLGLYGVGAVADMRRAEVDGSVAPVLLRFERSPQDSENDYKDRNEESIEKSISWCRQYMDVRHAP